MIRFCCSPKPAGFEDRVERRGQEWLAANPTGRPPDYWSEYKPALADSFGSLCAYGAMHEPVGTVDHFVSCDEDRTRAYEWTNYRFAAAWINSSKQSLRAEEIVDPFLVEDDWYELAFGLGDRKIQASEQVDDGDSRWDGRLFEPMRVTGASVPFLMPPEQHLVGAYAGGRRSATGPKGTDTRGSSSIAYRTSTPSPTFATTAAGSFL